MEGYEMKSTTIRLSSIEAVRNFVDVVRKYNCDIDLVSGRYLVDAKSIMGIFSLDLSRELELSVHSDSCDDFINEIEKYIVK